MCSEVHFYPLTMPDNFRNATKMAYAPNTSEGPIIYLATDHELMKIIVAQCNFEIFTFDMTITAMRYIFPEQCGDFLKKKMMKMEYSLEKEGCLLINTGICVNVLLFKPDIRKMTTLYHNYKVFPPHEIFFVEDELYICKRGWHKYNIRTGVKKSYYKNRFDTVMITDKVIITKQQTELSVHDLNMRRIKKFDYTQELDTVFVYQGSPNLLFMDTLRDNNLVAIDENMNVRKLKIHVSKFSRFVCAGNKLIASYVPALNWNHAFVFIYSNIDTV
jgi:hypothetical protein